LQKHNIEFAL